MAENNDFAMGYAMGQDSGGCNDGMGFGGGWGGLLGLIVVASLFGWGGMGMGGFGWGGGGGAGLQGMATRADINEGFALQNLTNGITGIQSGLCDGFHNQTVATMQGFTNLGHQVSDCCCATQRAIDGVRYDMASQACDTRNLIQTTTRDLIDNANANTRQIMDFLVNDKISALQAENQSLKFAASQANQNAVLMAAMDANKAELLRRTGHDCPTAAYIVQPPTPVSFPTNSCNTVQWGGYGNGCGLAA